MPKIDGLPYPDQAKDVLQDRLIGPMLRAYLDKKMCSEKYVFLDAMAKGRDPNKQFKLFFADNAKCPVNAGSDALVTAKRLGQPQDWKSRDWGKVFDIAENTTDAFITGEFIDPFYQKDPAFRAHHVYMLEKQILRKNYPALMTELNTTDKKAVANVAALLKADKKSGAKATKDFTRKKKIGMKPADVIKTIKKAMKIA